MSETTQAQTIEERYPEHIKLAAIADKSQAIGDFIENSEYILAEHREVEEYLEPQLLPVHTPISTILAEYYGIDEAKLEAEKRAMLAEMRGE